MPRPVRRSARSRRPAPSRRFSLSGVFALLVPLALLVAIGINPGSPTTGSSPTPSVDPSRAPGRLWLVPLIGGTQTADPSGQTIEGCIATFAGENERYGCMAGVMAHIGETSTPANAVSAIAAQNETYPEFAAECHMLSHAVGIGVFRVIGMERVNEAIGIDSGLCGGGYHHGVIVSLAKSDPRFEADDPVTVASAFAEVCRMGTISETTPLERNCIHGSGHAIVVIHDYDIPKAIKVCQAYGDLPVQPGEVDGSERVTSCAHGAFMENGWSGRVIGGPWTRLDDPSYPCAEFGDLGASCWFNVPYQMAGDNYTRAEVAEVCDTAGTERWAAECWVGFSRSAASVISPETTAARCEGTSDDWGMPRCIAEAAAELIDLFADPDAALATCLVPENGDPAVCARSVGEASARTVVPDPCDRFEAATLRDACRAGYRGDPQ
jgi:hypothetical protein